jgi:hypothetical protein
MFLNVKRYTSKSPFHSKSTKHYGHRINPIHVSKTPPPSPEDNNEELEDPILKKVSYIDPGMMSYKRATFESLFYKIPTPLTGSELKLLTKGHKLKFSIEKDIIILLIFNHLWTDANDVVWENMAELLSDWCSESILRETLPPLLTLESVFDGKDFISIPLGVKHHPPPSSIKETDG